MRFRPLRLAAVSTLMVAAAAAATISCKKETPPAPAAATAPSSSASKEAFPLPNDLAFNPLADLANGQTGASADDPSNAPGGADGKGPAEPARKATLKTPGAEPRTPLVYDFTTAKSEVLVATVKASARQEGAGAPAQTSEQPPLKFTLVVAPSTKGKGDGGRTPFTMKVAKVELLAPPGASIPKEVQGQLEQVATILAKMSLAFQVDPHGVLADLGFVGAEQAHPALADIVPLVQQSTELLFVLTPDEPVGVGATWTSTSASPEQGGALLATYTLKERTATTAVVQIETVTEMPARPVPDPRAPPGTTMGMKAKGLYTLTLRLNGPAQKASGEKEQRITIKDPSAKPPRTVAQVVKMSQTIESAPASAALAKSPSGAAPALKKPSTTD